MPQVAPACFQFELFSSGPYRLGHLAKVQVRTWFFCSDFYVYVLGKSGSSCFVLCIVLCTCFIHLNNMTTYRYIHINIYRTFISNIMIYHPSAHLSLPPNLTWCICRLDQASHRSFKQPTPCSRHFANIHARPHLSNLLREKTLAGTVLRSSRSRVLKEAM